MEEIKQGNELQKQQETNDAKQNKYLDYKVLFCTDSDNAATVKKEFFETFEKAATRAEELRSQGYRAMICDNIIATVNTVNGWILTDAYSCQYSKLTKTDADGYETWAFTQAGEANINNHGATRVYGKAHISLKDFTDEKIQEYIADYGEDISQIKQKYESKWQHIILRRIFMKQCDLGEEMDFDYEASGTISAYHDIMSSIKLNPLSEEPGPMDWLALNWETMPNRIRIEFDLIISVNAIDAMKTAISSSLVNFDLKDICVDHFTKSPSYKNKLRQIMIDKGIDEKYIKAFDNTTGDDILQLYGFINKYKITYIPDPASIPEADTSPEKISFSVPCSFNASRFIEYTDADEEFEKAQKEKSTEVKSITHD